MSGPCSVRDVDRFSEFGLKERSSGLDRCGSQWSPHRLRCACTPVAQTSWPIPASSSAKSMAISAVILDHEHTKGSHQLANPLWPDCKCNVARPQRLTVTDTNNYQRKLVHLVNTCHCPCCSMLAEAALRHEHLERTRVLLLRWCRSCVGRYSTPHWQDKLIEPCKKSLKLG